MLPIADELAGRGKGLGRSGRLALDMETVVRKLIAVLHEESES
jgi:hypothetical protein